MVCSVSFTNCFWFWRRISFSQIIQYSKKWEQDQLWWKFSIQWYVSIKAFSFNKLQQNVLLLLHNYSLYWTSIWCFNNRCERERIPRTMGKCTEWNKYVVLWIYCFYLFPLCVTACNCFMLVSFWKFGRWMLLQDMNSNYPIALPLRKPYSGDPGKFQESSLI